jgi:catechol 2,3-dioxygenase-like lactoylglutathione lyase family enzyme
MRGRHALEHGDRDVHQRVPLAAVDSIPAMPHTPLVDRRPPMTTVVAAEPQLYVRDITASSAFYSRTLGFTVAFTYGEPPFYGQVVRDGARLNLRQVDTPVVDPIRRDREQLLAASVTLTDAEPLFLEYQTAGAEIVQSLRTEAWGAQTFMVRDPDGNLLLFAGPAE